MDIVFGGSFNPPTVAHYRIAARVMSAYPDAAFYFLPTGQAYWKAGLIADGHRLAMLELLCQRLGPRAAVSDLEIRDATYGGTYRSLKHFKDPVFLLGADNLAGIKNWINFPAVVAENRFIVVPRLGADVGEILSRDSLKDYRDHFTILDIGKLDIAASAYRNTKDDKYLLPEVAQYIKENNLYKE
ncbi:MAG TPA: hypothetical protein GX390_01975 [Acholeplasmataceae bacterium]|jgi:nicotinate-nucleotide adenylyltransferase|nr:hypothetical protein [Acholeplasmataceae bacterium]